MKPRFCIAIPVFDNPDTIAAVVRSALAYSPHPLVVVDDGSRQPVTELVPADPRLTILRHPQNEGKGAALRTLFEWAVGRGFTHVITLDGDGQHRAEDIPQLAAAAEKDPWALVIGVRNLTGEHVPGISLFGRKFSNFWIQYESGTMVSDSQSGFRVYPLFHVQTMRFTRKRFDFEIEVLTRLLWKGVAVVEVPVESYYPPKGERVSHFRKFVDNARITFLNIWLIAISLLRLPSSPVPTALAIGVGVFIGCTPFYGLHFWIAVPVAVLFRLNFLYLLLGEQISIHPLAPFLAAASIQIGQALGFGSVLREWLAGSLVLGAGLGTILGTAAYFAHRALTERKQLWTGKSRGGVFGNWLIRTITRRLGMRAGYFCLYFVVPYFYLFAPKARRASHSYWRILRPELSYFGRVRAVLGHFLCFAQVLLDRMAQSHTREQKFISRAVGIDHIRQAAEKGTGLLIVGAHVGGWDIAARYLEWDGVRAPFHPVQLQASGVTFERNLNEREVSTVQKVVTNREALPILAIHSRLMEGNPIGLMADRPLTEQCELVPFLGRLALIDVAPFRIAAATKVPLVFSFGFKAEKNIYDFYCSRPRLLTYDPNRSRESQLKEWAEEFAAFLETHLRKYPRQWFNFFDFFGTLPFRVHPTTFASSSPKKAWAAVPSAS